MEYRLLGRTGVRVSALCLGTAFYGSLTPVDASIRLIHHALDDAGLNFVDTANTYGDRRFDYEGVPRDRPMVEEIVGRALRGRRHEVVLATKCGEPVGTGPNDRGLSRRHVMQQVEASLRRLGTDYVDLYYPHHPDPNTPIDQTLRAFDDLVRQGKVRYVGLSDYSAWQVVEALWVADRHNLGAPVCVQTLYNLFYRADERELMPACRKYGLSMVLFSPLAGGLLSGRYAPGMPPPAGSRAAFTRGERGRPAATPLLVEPYLSASQRLVELAGERGRTASQMALAWLLSHAEVAAAITGASTPEELDENAEAVGMALSGEEIAALESLLPASPVAR